ncbi:ZIP family metal transporter [Sinomicrobium weinanense]|uniref:ZIP family metal transporter n=1 Tax=Sinomicrobium weinanense TaxID=2842200 RepID=A0A926JT64_9FLAO|nr:ZIP family metal transporter [Sinomicrobium weinanense]MBC9796859.1 ZIP family metal transporter [Sinomicrobium weinanense]MBU3125232.1 ZIP family metal transporter [Sinomicrobium weinanense]
MIDYLLPIITVLIGFLFVILIKPKEGKYLKLFLAFSGAFLLSLTVFNLLPEIYHEEAGKTVGIFIMLGILLQIFLEFFSKGAEHGHVHAPGNMQTFPWLLFISLSIHSILEGFPLHRHDTLVYGIVVHKMPVAIVLTAFFLKTGMKKWHIAAFVSLFALMTPLGTFLGEHINGIEKFHAPISALIIGIFLHISTIILFESSEGHKFNLTKLAVIIAGILIAYIL